MPNKYDKNVCKENMKYFPPYDNIFLKTRFLSLIFENYIFYLKKTMFGAKYLIAPALT